MTIFTYIWAFHSHAPGEFFHSGRSYWSSYIWSRSKSNFQLFGLPFSGVNHFRQDWSSKVIKRMRITCTQQYNMLCSVIEKKVEWNFEEYCWRVGVVGFRRVPTSTFQSPELSSGGTWNWNYLDPKCKLVIIFNLVRTQLELLVFSIHRSNKKFEHWEPGLWQP